MNSVDENAKVGLELTTTSLRLTAKLLIGIMNLFLNKSDKKNYYQDLNTKKGQQKLKDLFDKGEVQPLEENISKKEMTNFKKEFKKMGVDFSVTKVGKDEYSLFFAGKDRGTIEKGMENSINKYVKNQNKKEQLKNVILKFRKEVEKEVNEDKANENMTPEEKENKIDDIVSKEVELEPTQKQLDLAEKLGMKDYKNMNKIELSLALEESGADKSFFNKNEKNKDNKKKNDINKNNKPNFNITDLQNKKKEKVLDNKKEKVRTKIPKRTI